MREFLEGIWAVTHQQAWALKGVPGYLRNVCMIGVPYAGLVYLQVHFFGCISPSCDALVSGEGLAGIVVLESCVVLILALSNYVAAGIWILAVAVISPLLVLGFWAGYIAVAITLFGVAALLLITALSASGWAFWGYLAAALATAAAGNRMLGSRSPSGATLPERYDDDEARRREEAERRTEDDNLASVRLKREAREKERRGW